MALKTLTKRTYLGEGYIHHYRNLTTGEVLIVPCTRGEYERLGTHGERAPERAGYKWEGSCGGTIKVDTPNTVLGLDEYCDLPDGRQVVRLNKGNGIETEVIMPANSVNAQNRVREEDVEAKRIADITDQGNQDPQ